MAYLITRFGESYAAGIELPVWDGSMPLGAGPVMSPLLALPGGHAFDVQGNAVMPTPSRAITLAGDWVAASLSAMESKIDALTALLGVRSYLWATNDGGTTTRSRLARCLDVRISQAAGSGLLVNVEMDFELLPGVWAGVEHAETTELDSTSVSVETTNGGNARVRDVVITVTAAGSAITAFSLYRDGYLHWHYTGSIAAGDALVVNSGTRAVTNDGTDDYAHLELQSDHPGSDWAPLEPGENTLTAERTGGNASSSIKLEYSDGWM